MRITLIAAVASDLAIGKDGDLLCHLPADLKHFKATTLGFPLIMGSSTYLSLPRRPLPHRRNIVLSSRPADLFLGAELASSIPQALELVAHEDEVFVIGGGQIYRQFLPLAQRLILTHIDHTFPDADTFFPAFSLDDFTITDRQSFPADDTHPYPYSFVTYIRK